MPTHVVGENIGVDKASHGDISQALENRQVNDLGRTTGPQNGNVDGAGHGHGWSPFSSLRSDASEPVRDARVDGHVACRGNERSTYVRVQTKVVADLQLQAADDRQPGRDNRVVQKRALDRRT